MSKRASLRLDWLHGNVRNLRREYGRTCRVALGRTHAWRTICAKGQNIRVLMNAGEGQSDCAIFYFHGGGWIVGSPETHADISNALSVHTGLPVISIDYRLAPEHKSPAAVMDGLDVLDHFLSGAGGCPGLQSAILCGDSAGGSIAMAVERHASPELRKRIRGVGSFYGCFARPRRKSVKAGMRDDGLDVASLRRYWSLANSSRGRGCYTLSVLDHAPGCPVYLLVAGRDPLRDESLALARALKRRGRAVMTDLLRYETHGFLQQPRHSRSVDLAFKRFSLWVHGISHSVLESVGD
jgi:acetyl esterase